MMPAVLALDQGSHASRACVFDRHGAVRAAATVDVATRHGNNGHIEQDPAELLASLLTATRQCLAAAPELRVEAAGLATQRSSILCCNPGTLTPLSAVLSWQDRRNAAWLAKLSSHETRVREITGLPLSAHYGASKMQWCAQHLPAVAAARRNQQLCFAPLASWLAARLVNGTTMQADPANASRTLLLDTASMDWSPELLQLFGVAVGELPACGATDALQGELNIDGRRIALRAVSGDQSAVPFATGEPDQHSAYANLGTGAFIQRPLLNRPAQTAPLLGSVLSASARQRIYSLEGTVNGAGSALSWLVAKRQLDEARLWSELETLEDSRVLPVFQNGIGGLGSPWWKADLESHFVGSGTALECFAAVLESVAFMLASNFRLLAAAGPPLQRLLLSGGMSRSRWFCRRLAATLAVPVRRMPAEATGRGIAVLAAPALAAQWQPTDSEEFAPREVPGLRARQQSFEALIAAAVRA